jgi:hypothetical protein
VLIALGLTLLLNNVGLWNFHREGWALLLLLPAAALAIQAANLYRNAGYRVTLGSVGAALLAVDRTTCQ